MTTDLLSRLRERLPQAYQVRSLSMGCAEIIADLLNRANATGPYPSRHRAEEFEDMWAHALEMDFEQGSVLIENAQGLAVAYAIVWDDTNPPITPFLDWEIVQDEVDQVGDALLEWAQARVRENSVPRCPEDIQVMLRTGAFKGYEPYERLMLRQGFEAQRYFFRMRIDLSAEPEPVIAPEGFELRPFKDPEEWEALVLSNRRGFRDHYGFIERSNEEYLRHFAEWRQSKTFDASLWFVAVEQSTGAVAATVLCTMEEEGDPDVAYVASVATDRPYRGKGLALSLLKLSFAEFWRRGRPSIALHVDAQNPTGALGLYTKAGMFVEQESVGWNKIIRDGRVLMNQG